VPLNHRMYSAIAAAGGGLAGPRLLVEDLDFE
jgi:hypothetical protein